MYRPDIKRKKSGAPILSRKEIDIIGENLVDEFMPEALKTPQEIDIDLFVQDYLGMEQDFQYLSHCGIYLGMTVFNDTDKIPVYNPVDHCAEYISARAHTVIIDNTLLEKIRNIGIGLLWGMRQATGIYIRSILLMIPIR